MRKILGLPRLLVLAATVLATVVLAPGPAQADQFPSGAVFVSPVDGATYQQGWQGDITIDFTNASLGSYFVTERCYDESGFDTERSFTIVYDGSFTTATRPSPIETWNYTACDFDSNANTFAHVNLTRFPLRFTDVKTSTRTFYPRVRDHYLDVVRTSFTLNRPAATQARVVNAHGATVRHVNLGPLDLGTHSWSWGGYTDHGRQAPLGSYRIRLYARTGDGSYQQGVTTGPVRLARKARWVSGSRRLNGDDSARHTTGSCHEDDWSPARAVNFFCGRRGLATAVFSFHVPASARHLRFAVVRRSSGPETTRVWAKRAGARSYKVHATVRKSGWSTLYSATVHFSWLRHY